MNNITKPIIVNIETYGDFDILVSASIMQAPIGMTKQTVREAIEEAEEMFGESRDVDKVVRYLKSQWSFETVKFYNLRIGGKL